MQELKLFEQSEIISFENTIVRALWWNQPYASLMLHGKWETRRYPTKVRGNVLICSCKRRYHLGEIMEISGRSQFDRMASYLIGNEAGITGMAIAISNLVDCIPMKPEYEDKCFVQYSQSKWCWIFENVTPIQPFEIKGKQGWAILSDE